MAEISQHQEINLQTEHSVCTVFSITDLATQYWHQIKELEKSLNKALKRIDELENTVKEQARIIAIREERIAELEEEVRKLKGTGKKLKDIVFKPEDKNTDKLKRGAKKGHRGFFRRKPKQKDVTKRRKVRMKNCSKCNCILGAPHSWRQRYSIDIPPPQKPDIMEWNLARYHCKGCGHWVQGQPEGVFGKSLFGINLIMKVLDMKYRGKDTDEYIQETLKRWHSIDLSDGGIHSILNHASELFGSFYESIKQALIEGKIVQADETGWRVEGENWYAWAFLNKDVTLFQIENTRGGGIPKETLNGFKGALVHDAYQGYNSVEDAEHGICGVHFLRHTHDDLANSENASDEAKWFHKQMTWFFRKSRKKKKKCRNDEELLILHKQMSKAFERYWKDVVYDDPLVESTRKWWLEERGDQLLMFLKYDYVPWDNNAAERAVRPMVRRRKITGGSRSIRGSEREAINMSCISTLLKQGKDLFEEVPILWQASMVSANS